MTQIEQSDSVFKFNLDESKIKKSATVKKTTSILFNTLLKTKQSKIKKYKHSVRNEQLVTAAKTSRGKTTQIKGEIL